MPAYSPNKSIAPGMPEMPAIASEFLKIANDPANQASLLAGLIERYPQFFNRLLKVINADHFNLSSKVSSIQQAISISGIERITELLIIQVVYRTLNQYKILGIDIQLFWQDSLRRAVSARMIGEMTGLDAGQCFCAGFLQDIGFLLLFLDQPDKGILWSEFHKREPEARLNMEQNVFAAQHLNKLAVFMEAWNILPHLKLSLSSHHHCHTAELADLDKQLCKVLHCADWLSAVFTADDKSYVISRCTKLLSENFEMETYRVEGLLESIPDEVDLTAQALDIKIKDHTAFSQILYQANTRLNEDNDNFQELTLRLEQALEERDKLASDVNRDLNLAREIQRSLLPDDPVDDYPVHGINLSARILSGDFYDFFELGNGDIYFNLGDVSGKGVNAALLMAKTSSLFRCLGKRIFDPGKLLYEINNELCETSVRGMFVTMVAGVYSPVTGLVKLVNAGHPPALLFTRKGICCEYSATAPPLGVVQNTTYNECEINLQDDSLYIYSDGITEGYVNKKAVLEIGGLFKIIATMDVKLPATERLKIIVNKFTNGSRPLRDDITILLLEKNNNAAS